jgi:hypothetical protein
VSELSDYPDLSDLVEGDTIVIYNGVGNRTVAADGTQIYDILPGAELTKLS